MTLQLLNTSADHRALSKSATELDTVSCKIKQGTSIINPVVVIKKISAKKIRQLNYAYIKDFGRYYFIENIVEAPADQLEISMHVDVMRTYASDIRAISTLVLRQENVFSPYYIDDEALTRTTRSRTKKNIGVVGGDSTHYYLTVSNGGE